jgi:hypothetical protein
MTDLPAEVATATVTWDAEQLVRNATSGAISLDDLGDSAQITFAPTPKLLLLQGATKMLLPTGPIVAPLSAGSQAGLIRTDNANVSPTGWTWVAQIAAPTTGYTFDPIPFVLDSTTLDADGSADLAMLTPLPRADGVPIVRGPRTDITGGTATSLPYGSDPTVTVTDGDGNTETVNFGIPVGPPGAGVPDTAAASDGDWIYYDSGTTKWGAPGVASSAISDATTVGKTVLTAADQAAARSAIGAGTSSLTLGITSTTALAGNTAIPDSAEDVGAVANASGQTLTLWAGTQDDYDALTPDDNTVYVVTA